MATIQDLVEAARKLTSSVRTSDPLPTVSLSREKVEGLKEATQLGELVQIVLLKADNPDQQDVLAYQNLVLLEALMRNPNGVNKASQAGEQAAVLQDYIVSILVPPPMFATIESTIPRTLATHPKLDILRFQLRGTIGLRALSHLAHHFPELRNHDTLNVIQCLACYTSCADPWVRPGSDEIAKNLLKPLVEQPCSPLKPECLLSEILVEVVQPAFAANKPRSITLAGRKAINPLPEPMHAHGDNLRLKPWKHNKFFVVAILRWLIGQLNDETAGKYWHLITPPILTLIDDEDTVSRLKGCDLLQALLKSAPNSLLLNTGLGEVFIEALFPLLSLLPTLTPEDESLSLQKSAYSSLLALAKKQYVNHEDQPSKRRLLDRIMRTGVLSGLAHSGEYVKLAALLLSKMSLLIDELGIWSAKHLKHVIPLLKSYLCSPLVLNAFELLEASVLAVQRVLLVDWPRIEVHSIEIFQGICVCWHRNNYELPQSVQHAKVEKMLQSTLNLLLAGLSGGSRAKKDIEVTVQNDHRLHGLLQNVAEA